jgi:glycosyltransferase involved in cell wall biosynthesis
VTDAADPTVSVVIPTRNRRDRCAHAIRSALAQTHAPLEVIVCDDASDDDTSAMVSALASGDPRIRLVAGRQSPSGPGPSRNRGIAIAQGRLTAFLDDDDEWLPQKLERQIAHVADGVVVCADAFAGGTRRWFGDEALCRFGLAQALIANPVITSTAIVPTGSLRHVGGFSEARRRQGVEDYDLWLRLLDHGLGILRLPDPLVVYDDRSAGRLSDRDHLPRAALLMVERWLRAPDSASARQAARRQVAALAWRPVAAGRAWHLGRRDGAV